jgi:hypothetical protein
MTTRALRHSLSAALLLATAARADWQGKLVTTTDPPQPDRSGMGRDGEVHAKKGKMRIDTQIGPVGKGYVLYDFKTKKLNLVVPDQKIYFEQDAPADGAAEAPAGCERGSAEECLASQGFKKDGADQVEGRACETWERDRAVRGGMDVHQKVCVLAGAKDMVWLKNEVQTPRFTRVTIVKDYKQAPQPDSLFEVPKGYARQDMAAMMEKMGAGPRRAPPPGPPANLQPADK